MGIYRRAKEVHLGAEDKVSALIKSINHFRLEPFINLTEDRIIGFEVLSSLKTGMLPEHWFAEQKTADLIDFVKYQLTYVSSLQLREVCFYNLSIKTLLHLAADDIRFMTQFNKVAIEISDIYNMKHFNADEHAVFFNHVALLRKGGIEVWLDDFTAEELMSLYFYWGRIDGIKIDRSEVNQPWLRKEISMITDVVGNINILVEGVESEEDLSTVKKSGARLAQGYLWNVDNLILDVSI